MSKDNTFFLGEICDIIAGQSPPSNTYNKKGEGLPFFQGKADFGVFFPKVRVWCNAPQKIAKKGDILISVRAPVGPTNVSDQDCCIGRGLSAIRAKDKINSDYLRYFLKNKEAILSGQGRGSTFSSITQKDLKEIKVPLPPLKDQKKIVQILDTADSLRPKRKEQIKLLDDYLKSVFLEMFGDPVRNEKRLEKVKLGNLGIISSGSTPSRKKSEYFGGKIPWVKTTEVKGGFISSTGESITNDGLNNSSCKIYPPNSVLVAMYGQGKTRGMTGILKIGAATNQACAVIEPNSKYNSVYLFSLLRISYKSLRNLGRGGNQANLNVGMIKNYQCFLPPIELQNRFASIVEQVEQTKQKMRASLQEMDNHFNALMQSYFG